MSVVGSSSPTGYLHNLCRHGNVTAIRPFLQGIVDTRQLEERVGFLGYTPLHEATNRGQTSVVRLLLFYGADPNAKANGFYTPLHIAASMDNVSCVEELLKHDADITCKDEFGKTPYETAMIHRCKKSAQILKSEEVKKAARENCPNIREMLKAVKSHDVLPSCFREALLEASCVGNMGAICAIIVTGARHSLKLKDCLTEALRFNFNKTAAMLLVCYAAKHDKIDLLKYLLNVPMDNEEKEQALSDLPHEVHSHASLCEMRSYISDRDNFNIAVPIGLALQQKKKKSVEILLLSTDCNQNQKRVDWQKLALGEIDTSWLQHIQWVEKLFLSSNLLTSIPNDIVVLKTLCRLDLRRNQLKSVPVELLQMPTLRDLNLSENRILELPKRCAWTQSLKTLYLTDNLLETLPRSMGRAKLFNLYLARNSLYKVPACIWELLTLQTLDLSGNARLTQLPPQMGKLTEITTLKLDNLDQMTDPPEEIKRNGVKTMMYLRDKLRSSQGYYTMKLMLVGRAEQGKTTLMHRLMRDYAYNTNSPTNGIGMDEFRYRKDMFHREYIFKVWDFGGQEDFYTTHQCFLSTLALYLLVWNLEQGESGIDMLKSWLNTICASAPGTNIIVVGTHLDKVRKDKDVGYPARMRELVTQLVTSPQYNQICVKGIKEVSCGMDNREGIDDLRITIYDVATSLHKGGLGQVSIMGEMIPHSFLLVAEVIQAKREELQNAGKIPIMHKSEYEALVLDTIKNDMCDIEDSNDLRVVTEFMHERGVLMHYNDPNQDLQDLYFIDPKWLCQLMAQIVTLPEVNPYIRDGILVLDSTSLPFIFKGERFPQENYNQFIRLLNRFQIACSLDNKRVLIPSKLPTRRPDEATSSDLHYITLKRIHSLPSIPHGFWSRLISRVLFYATDMLSVGENYDREKYSGPFQLDPFCCRCPLILDASTSTEPSASTDETDQIPRCETVESLTGVSLENIQDTADGFKGIARYFNEDDLHRHGGLFINGLFFGSTKFGSGSLHSDSGFEYSSGDDEEDPSAAPGRAWPSHSREVGRVHSWRNAAKLKYGTDPTGRSNGKIADVDIGTPMSDSAIPVLQKASVFMSSDDEHIPQMSSGGALVIQGSSYGAEDDIVPQCWSDAVGSDQVSHGTSYCARNDNVPHDSSYAVGDNNVPRDSLFCAADKDVPQGNFHGAGHINVPQGCVYGVRDANVSEESPSITGVIIAQERASHITENVDVQKVSSDILPEVPSNVSQSVDGCEINSDDTKNGDVPEESTYRTMYADAPQVSSDSIDVHVPQVRSSVRREANFLTESSVSSAAVDESQIAPDVAEDSPSPIVVDLSKLNVSPQKDDCTKDDETLDDKHAVVNGVDGHYTQENRPSRPEDSFSESIECEIAFSHDLCAAPSYPEQLPSTDGLASVKSWLDNTGNHYEGYRFPDNGALASCAQQSDHTQSSSSSSSVSTEQDPAEIQFSVGAASSLNSEFQDSVSVSDNQDTSIDANSTSIETSFKQHEDHDVVIAKGDGNKDGCSNDVQSKFSNTSNQEGYSTTCTTSDLQEAQQKQNVIQDTALDAGEDPAPRCETPHLPYCPFREDFPIESLPELPTDLPTLMDNLFLRCWQSGVCLRHPRLFFLLYCIPDPNSDRKLIVIEVSPSPLGRRVLSYMVDHIDTLVREWYPEFAATDGSRPKVRQLISCIACERLGLKPHQFTFAQCQMQSAASDTISCPNHSQVEVNLHHVAPDIMLHDVDADLLLHHDEIKYENSDASILGSGGFGKVVRGECKGQAVAIKFYNQNDESDPLRHYREIRKELNVLRRVRQHPFLINIIGVSLRPLCLVLELAERGALTEILVTPMAIHRVVLFRIAYQVADALRFLHDLGVIYRDLKPENVLVWSLEERDDLHVKLIDFGTANFATSVGLISCKGSRGNHAPEMLQCANKEEYTAQVDVYSFGILLYQLITRLPPFDEIDSEPMVNTAVIAGDRPKWRHVPTAMFGLPTLTELMLHCWAGKPTKRPTSAQVAEQICQPAFQCLLGKQSIPCQQSVRHACLVPELHELWLACDDHTGNRILVYDGRTLDMKFSFSIDVDQEQKNAFQIQCVHFTAPYVLIALRGSADVIKAYSVSNAANHKCVASMTFNEQISCMASNEAYIFVGLNEGRVHCILRTEIKKSDKKRNHRVISAGHHRILSLVVLKDKLWVSSSKYIFKFFTKQGVMDAFELESMWYGGPNGMENNPQTQVTLLRTSFDKESVLSVCRSVLCKWDADSRQKHFSLDCAPVIRRLTADSKRHPCELNNLEACITSVEPTFDSLWVGTASGFILIFDAAESGLLTWFHTFNEVRTLTMAIGPGPCGTEQCYVISTGKGLRSDGLGAVCLLSDEKVREPREEVSDRKVSDGSRTKTHKRTLSGRKLKSSSFEEEEKPAVEAVTPSYAKCSMIVWEVVSKSSFARLEAKRAPTPQ